MQKQGSRGRGGAGCSRESSKAPWLPILAGCSSSPVMDWVMVVILTDQNWALFSLRKLPENISSNTDQAGYKAVQDLDKSF